ncbi:MAG: TIGR03435 family protein [Acidobacteriota bacterium]|nr:TIGR03435 family protein [Acidobacteriota bacterium]
MILSAQRTFKALAFFLTFSVCAYARAAEPEPASVTASAQAAFDLADVHVSAHSTAPFFTGGSLRGDRYVLHNATMVDMISLAYGVSGDNVLSGPSWMDFDRFDVSAGAPRGTSPDEIKLMLQALLAERFHLVAHKDTHPSPSYVLRVDSGGLKMKQADEGEAPKLDEHHTPNDNPPGVPAYYSVTVRNGTMPRIRQLLQDFASQYLPKPVIDATDLKGGYDFDLHWTWKPAPDGLTIFDAVQKQLGLKLALEQYPTPVVIVDKVDEKPMPNAPGLEKALPPLPPLEFDVAVITPSKPDSPFQGRITGNQVNATGMNLKFLISFAYNLNNNDEELIQNAPKFISQDRWDILAKAAPEAQAVGPDGKPQVDFDLLPHMIQTMLAERFQMKSHFEDRIIDAFSLVAANPKMKKADPLNRTHCKEGPGPDGKDPRIANPILGRLLYCQNMTMGQLADLLPSLAGGYIFTPVLDSTGLKDAYDFTLSFSTAGQLNSAPPPPPTNDPNAASTAEPNGGLSLPDAMARQLGVKLVKEKRPSPVLVIDHIEQKPTDN